MVKTALLQILIFVLSCCVNVSWQVQIDVSVDFMKKLVNRVEYLELKLAEQVDLGHRQTLALDQQQDELHHQKTELAQQKIDLGQQKAELDEQKAEIHQQKTEIHQQKAELYQQKAELDQQKVELDQQKVELGQHKDELDQQTVELEKVKMELSEMKLSQRNSVKMEKNHEDLNSITEKNGADIFRESKQNVEHVPHIGIRQVETPPPIAFTAYLDHNIKNLGVDQIIKYDKVLLNVGSAYNIHTGIFACPIDGLYVFNFVISTYGEHQTFAKLVKDGTNQLDGVSETVTAGHDAQGGNFMILSLTQGQSVWIASYIQSSQAIDGGNDVKFSSFSGFLLQ